MTKHAKKTEPLQLVDRRKTATVRIPVPFLDVLASIEHSFFDLCIAAGRQVLDAMIEQDREALCGPRSRRDPDRRAGRAGTTTSEVTLGGRRIRIPRPRVRSTAGEELALPSYVFAAQRDPLDNHTLNAVACGISTRRYARSLEPLTEDLDERSTSKSAVSRRYVALSTQRMTAWLTTPLGDRHFPIVLIDGLILGDHTVLMALGIDTEGKKQVLGLREGTAENSQVVKALLRDLIDRGLDPARARLFVVDGAKALQTAIRKIFGPLGVMQRCQIHKRRNILGHLPEHQHARVRAALTEAWSLGDAEHATRRLVRLAASLDAAHPGAAASVREGLAATLTLQTLGIGGTLYRKLRSTNAIENLNSRVVTYARHVKRWQNGAMVVRWVSTGIVEAEKTFRRVQGYRDIAQLVHVLSALEVTEEEAPGERVA